MRAGGLGHICDQGTTSREVRRLQITASRLATAIFAGEYRSAFRGRGIEFDEVREYQPGDDVRSIDWNVTARQGHPFIKRFVEERELTVVLLVDRSPSMQFGTVRSTKFETAAEACALLAFAALRSHDRTGLLSMGDGRLRYLPPGKGKRHTLRLVREITAPEREGSEGSGLEQALEHLDRVLKGRAVVCLFSDFIEPVPFRSLASLSSRHDVVAVAVSDPAEKELPDSGLILLSDPETGSISALDSNDPSTRRTYRALTEQMRTERKREVSRSGARYLELGTQTPPIHALIDFFQGKYRRRCP